jgi:hypothetical protein
VRPGITDLSSIVFADEGEILKGAADPDLAYNQLIRPWKSRLSLLYVRTASVWLDLRLIVLTVVGLLSRARALAGVQRVLDDLDADEGLCQMATRAKPLEPYPPPGATSVVMHR